MLMEVMTVAVNVVVGPPFAGKSVFVSENAGAGVPRFDFDAVATVVGGVDKPEADVSPGVVDAVLAMRRGLVGWLLDPETVVDELWFVSENPPAALISKFEGVGAVFHLVDPGRDVCVERATEAGASDDVLARIDAWYENPPELPGGEKGGVALMKLKDLKVRVKEPDDVEVEAGEIVAYASVFDNVDSYGDVIRKGAFADTLKEWEESGNQLPLLYGHDFRDPFSNIGTVVEAVEDDHGLKIRAKLDLDNEKASQVYRLLKERRLSQMSFAFDVVEGAEMKDNDNWIFEIRKVRLYEVSVVPIGANQETEVLAVKAAESGAEMSKAMALMLKSMRDALAGNDTDPEVTPPSGFSHAAKKSGDNQGALNKLGARLMILEKEKH